MRSSIIHIFLVSLLCADCTTTAKKEKLSEAHNLCYSYIYGKNSFELDYDKAFEWCAIAANLGGDSAQTLLAELYFYGNGVERNYKTAGKLYKKAARKGHSHAQMMVFVVNNIYRPRSSAIEEQVDGIFYLSDAVKAGYAPAIELSKKIYGH